MYMAQLYPKIRKKNEKEKNEWKALNECSLVFSRKQWNCLSPIVAPLRLLCARRNVLETSVKKTKNKTKTVKENIRRKFILFFSPLKIASLIWKYFFFFIFYLTFYNSKVTLNKSWKSNQRCSVIRTHNPYWKSILRFFFSFLFCYHQKVNMKFFSLSTNDSFFFLLNFISHRYPSRLVIVLFFFYYSRFLGQIRVFMLWPHKTSSFRDHFYSNNFLSGGINCEMKWRKRGEKYKFIMVLMNDLCVDSISITKNALLFIFSIESSFYSMLVYSISNADP